MKSFVRALRQVWRISWLPLVLVAIFVIQNHLFNYWLNISPGNYVWRRSLVTTALGILLFAPALLINKRFKYPYLTVVSLLVALIFAAQYLYYSYSGGFLQASALFYAGEGVSILGTVKTLLNWHLIVFVAGLIIVVAAWVTDPTRGDNLTLPSPRLMRGS
jgi:hypothetical protein